MLTRRLLIPALLFVLPLGAAVAVVTEVGARQERVKICHNGHSITVAAPAIPAHLAHGDTLGACALGVPTATAVATETATNVPVETPTATETATNVPVETPTATETPTDVPVETPTATETATNVPVETPTATETATNVPVETPTETPADATETPTNTPSAASLTSIDAALALQYASGLLGNGASPGRMDINRDGRIDAIDAALILQRIAGLIG